MKISRLSSSISRYWSWRAESGLASRLPRWVVRPKIPMNLAVIMKEGFITRAFGHDQNTVGLSQTRGYRLDSFSSLVDCMYGNT